MGIAPELEDEVDRLSEILEERNAHIRDLEAGLSESEERRIYLQRQSDSFEMEAEEHLAELSRLRAGVEPFVKMARRYEDADAWAGKRTPDSFWIYVELGACRNIAALTAAFTPKNERK